MFNMFVKINLQKCPENMKVLELHPSLKEDAKRGEKNCSCSLTYPLARFPPLFLAYQQS